MSKTRAVQHRIPEQLDQRLRAEAERRMVSTSYLVTRAVERFLDDSDRGRPLLAEMPGVTS